MIVLMAVLVGVAVPRFFGRGDFEGPAFAQELASAARYAQKVAVVSGCPVALVVTATGYSLLKPQDTTPKCTGALTLPVVHPATGGTFTGSVPGGVAIGGAPDTVQFSASGATDGDAAFTVGGRSVLIAADSGYVRVQ